MHFGNGSKPKGVYLSHEPESLLSSSESIISRIVLPLFHRHIALSAIGDTSTHDAGAVQGVCALTNCPEPNLVALPASATAGTICIYNLLATGVNVLCEVEAHRTPVVSCSALVPIVVPLADNAMFSMCTQNPVLLAPTM